MSHPRRLGVALLAALAAVASLAIVVAPSGAAGPPLPESRQRQHGGSRRHRRPDPDRVRLQRLDRLRRLRPERADGGPGGLFTVADGKATKVPGSPPIVFGLALKGSSLYVSTGPTIVAMSGWNGTKFASTKTVYANKEKGFPGFNGLAFGPEGRLYAGLALDEKYDHSKDPFEPSQALVSMTAAGKGLKVVTEGLRQPFQMVFPKGSKFPWVTVLSQDKGKVPNDEIVQAKPGQNYGFPTCTWPAASQKVCKGFNEPAILLPPHSSPMGIGGDRQHVLRVAVRRRPGKGPEVVTMSKKGQPSPFLTGFAAPTIALGVNNGSVYVGDLTGTIYKVAAK